MQATLIQNDYFIQTVQSVITIAHELIGRIYNYQFKGSNKSPTNKSYGLKETNFKSSDDLLKIQAKPEKRSLASKLKGKLCKNFVSN